MRKKLFSACFILAAVLSLMTVSALAADVSSVEELQAAIDSAGNDEVINLSKSFSTENANIEVKDIEGKVKRTITINLEGTPRPYELVLGTGSIVVEGNNTLIIKGGTIVGSGNQVVEVKDGALDVQGTTVINDGSGIGVSITQTGGNLTMTDGIIQAKNGCAVYQSTFGTTTEIKGGTVTGAVGIVADAGWIFVGTENPGTPPTDPPIIEATGSGTRRVGNNQIRAAGIAFTQSVLSHITIYNGQVLSKNAEAIYSINAGSDAEIDIMGGTFSSDVSGSGFVPDAVAMLIHKDDSDADYTYYTYYTTPEDAITKAQTGDTVKLLKDAGTDSPVNISIINKAITLDLGTNTNSKTINGKLTINDSNNNVAINGGAIKGGTIAISDAGVNITGSTITSGTGADPAVLVSSGTVTISNTTITGTATGVSVTGGTLTVDGTTTITGTNGAGITGGGVDTSVTINGGTITGTTDGITFGGKELNLTGGNIKGTVNGISATSGELNITNGTIEGATNGVSVTGGTLNLTGGTIRGTGTENANGIYIETSSTDSTISGGTITGTTNGIKVELGTLTVKSGTINNSPNGIAVSGGTLNLTGGNITGLEYGISVTSGEVTVENVTIRTTGATGVGIGVSGTSELTVKSGDINANTGIIFSGDELTISEGTITANTTGIIFSDGKLTISGGTIMGSSEDGVKISSGTATISGGTITGMNGNGVSLTGGSLTVEGTTSSPMITGRSGAGIAVSGSGALTVKGGTIEGTGTGAGAYGISVEYGDSTTVTIGKTGEENKNDNKDILISGGTALYIFEDPAASPATPEIKVYSGTFQSTSVISKTVDSSINGFIYGGKFINNTGSKDQLPPLYLFAERTQKSDGTVVPIAEGDIKVTFNLGGGEFEDGSNSYELIVAAGDTFNKNDMPPDPILDGYVFVGWFTQDGEEPPYGRVISTNITIYAHWDQLLTFIFDADPYGDFRGEKDPYPYEHTITVGPKESGIIKGQKLSKDKWPTDPIYNDGDEFVFGGWYTTAQPGGTKVDYDTPFEESLVEGGTVTLYAHWGYKITFDLNYTGAPRVDYLVTEEKDAKHILTEWPKIPEERTADWEFDGWFIGDECKAEEEPEDPDETTRLDSDHEFTEHTAVHAHWTEKVDVTLTEPELKDKADKEIKVLTSEEEEPKIILTVTGRNASFRETVDESHFTLFMDDKPVAGVIVESAAIYEDPETGEKDYTKVVITLDQAPQKAGTLTIKVDGKAFPSPPKKDATVEIAVTYAVEFDPKGGTFADGSTTSQTLNTDITGTLTSLPADPELEGYGFVGWFIGDVSGECDNDDTICTKVVLGEESAVFTANTPEDAPVHAHWKQLSFTIEFDPSPGRFVDGTETPVTRATSNSGYLGKAVFDELSNLIKADSNPNHTFDGWYTEQNGGGDEVTMDYQFDKSTTVYAYWHQNPPYTITFDLDYDGADSKTAEAKGKEGELTGQVDEADWPDEDYTERTGYKFLGWYTKKTSEEGGEPVDKSYVFTNDTTLYAHWGYEITFNANGGTFGVEEKDDDGNEIIIMATDETFKLAEEDIDPPTSPEAGYVFGGWYTDPERGDPVDFGKPFKGKTTVYAHWDQSVALEADISELTAGGTVKEITLTITTEDVTFVSGVDKSLFELSGAAAEGLSIESIVRSANGKEVKITLNKAPDVAGTLTITVKGAAFSPRNADKATVSITVRLPVYTITFDPNGGELTGDTTAKTTDGKLSSLPTPTLDGYTFDGWYTAKEDGDKVTTDTVFTGDATIYAHWTKKTEDPGPGEPGKPDDPEPPEDDDRVYSVQIAFGSLHGRVSTDVMSAKKGTTVRITADPDSDYRVDSIRVTRDDTGATVSTGYTFAMPASNVTVTVKFSLRPEYNNFVPPQTQSQYQNQNQTQTGGAPATLPTSVFKPVTWRPAAALWDLSPTSWAYPAAQWAYQNGYLDTASDGTFRLNDTVSHMQLWRIMARWQGEAALDDNSVTQWARRTGASRIGTSSGAMTRQNIVEYLYQCYFLLGGNVSVSGNLAQYRDSQTIVSASAKNAWIWAVNKGIISGTPDGALNPNGVLNRGEFASILMRLCQKG